MPSSPIRKLVPYAEAAKKKGVRVKGARVIVQGFGNAGYYIAKFMKEAGFRIAAASDSRGGVRSVPAQR